MYFWIQEFWQIKHRRRIIHTLLYHLGSFVNLKIPLFALKETLQIPVLSIDSSTQYIPVKTSSYLIGLSIGYIYFFGTQN
ncbi:hypothetical protein [Helicobacter cappadocius]|uniref:Uncharacterized protein n=1 Tax=Helicobacter cappadocius TaxID=3063998 RepID=A0AA90SSW2_9HELI|nr:MULTISPECIES: hypothetical protein [unclassified Helicobacter]MDO7253447.1 hypothetical protein [Helicobacter sp. faydin-H75]MDP2539374.1 hypothetical protein [Helicobacter sp. faydin-H76]